MSIIKINNNFLDFSITNQDTILFIISSFLKPNDVINFTSLCKQMLNIKNIYIHFVKITNIKKLNFIVKKYNFIKVNKLLLNCSLNEKNIKKLNTFINVKKLCIGNKILKINEVVKYYSDKNITDIEFKGDIFLSENNFFQKSTILYETINNIIYISKIKSISFIENTIVDNNYNKLNLTNIIKASFTYCNCSIVNLPIVESLLYLEITTNLLLNIHISDVLEIFDNKFPNLQILYIQTSSDEDYYETIDTIKFLLKHSKYIIKLNNFNNDTIMSYVYFKDIENIKDFNNMIENIISNPFLRYLTVVIRKKDSNSPILLLIYYFSITRFMNIIYKNGNSKKSIVKDIVSNKKFNIEFNNL
jgi:hypothetical protein